MSELEFLKRWMSALNDIDPNMRGKVNGVSISLTGKFIGIDRNGKVEVCEVDNQADRFGPAAMPERSDGA